MGAVEVPNVSAKAYEPVATTPAITPTTPTSLCLMLVTLFLGYFDNWTGAGAETRDPLMYRPGVRTPNAPSNESTKI